MLSQKHFFDLQLFGDGGDGGSAGEGAGVATSGVTDGGEDLSAQVPRSIPERAKKRYIEALKKTRSVESKPQTTENHTEEPESAQSSTATTTEEAGAKPAKLSYSDLIKSDEYKAEHEAYMQKTISDRLKKYSGIEKENESAKELLYAMAEHHGIDRNSKTFFEDLKNAVNKDDSEQKVKKYLETHDVPYEEAQRIVGMEQKLTESRRQEELQKAALEEANRRQEQERLIQSMKASAEKTKAMYPNFDLESCLQNDAFRRICAVTGGDTTAAYVASHHTQIIQDTAKKATEQAAAQIANSVATNGKRPAENGIGTTSPSVAEIDFSKMNAKDLRKFWQENRDYLRRR